MNQPFPKLIACLLVGFLASVSAVKAEHFTAAEKAAVKFGVHEIVLTGHGLQGVNPT